MRIYEKDGIYVAEAEFQSEPVVVYARTWEEAKEKLLIRLLVLEMIG